MLRESWSKVKGEEAGSDWLLSEAASKLSYFQSSGKLPQLLSNCLQQLSSKSSNSSSSLLASSLQSMKSNLPATRSESCAVTYHNGILSSIRDSKLCTSYGGHSSLGSPRARGRLLGSPKTIFCVAQWSRS
jgi:hypothetical protein